MSTITLILTKIVQIALFLHVSSGFASIVLFWLPVFTKKGGNIHRKIGKAYIFLMWVVIFSGIVLTVNKFHEGMTDIVAMDGAIFLGFLVLLAARPVWYGIAILRSKEHLSPKLKHYHILLKISLAVYGLLMLVYAIYRQGEGMSPVMFVFALLGMMAGREAWMDYKSTSTHSNWLREHFEGMVFSGVAAYTAFFVIGGNELFGQYLNNFWIMVQWVSPTIIGMLLIFFYRNKFPK